MNENRLRTGSLTAFLTAFALFFLIGAQQSEASNVMGDNVLRSGMENQEVTQLQELLNERGYIEEITGVYDQRTAEAVRSFQQSASILVDGVAGPQTLGALQMLRQGDRGEAVYSLQGDLQDLGFYNGKLDGVFGPITHRSVKEFQKSENIFVDGLAGPQTYGKLHQAVSGGKTVVASASEQTSSSDPAENGPDQNSQSSESTSETSHADTESQSSSSEESTSSASDQDENAASESSATASESSSETVSRSASSDEPDGRTFTVEATAYTASCNGCSGITFTGLDLRSNPDKKVIAVDPSVIPLGSTVHVEGYGTYLAADTGGAINGNRIDIFMPERSDALAFGRRNLVITVLD
ncbi:peptidoglycan-binding protein [Alteribacter lacisalsi]|uniref:Peptidoglycan-binding protein n=1 Tax=Alteribacter lacisalsi TaxID=2045244 RepID=A0A2W0HAM1_9BACI|nr:peptidoglycan-binding protein [Alteribacter lacisalsi]PYZ98207.1 peptidoglycan-binding protein [Alteribacter lacisalsi]